MFALSFINLDSVEGMKQMLMMTGEENYRDAIVRFETSLINPISFMAVFCLLLIMSASFIPSILEKGNIDVLLSKPISRAKIIIGKFISVVVLAFLIITFLISIIWLMVSLKSGVWHFQFLVSILWFTFIFAILYSLEMLVGLISQSTILSLIITLSIFFPITALLSVKETLVFNFLKNDSIKFIFNFIYYIFPKPWDIRETCVDMIEGLSIQSWWPVITSAIFMLAMIYLSIFYFSKKDY